MISYPEASGEKWTLNFSKLVIFFATKSSDGSTEFPVSGIMNSTNSTMFSGPNETVLLEGSNQNKLGVSHPGKGHVLTNSLLSLSVLCTTTFF